MKPTTALCLAIAAAAFAGPANAIFKCTTAKGVVYQDRPCRDGNETDLQLVIPTGEIAPRGAADENSTANPSQPSRTDDRTAQRTPRNVGEAPATASKSAERRSGDSAASGADTPRRNPSATAEPTMTADQARKTDPSAKYFATEAFGTGSETPTQMNCESPSGERRTFYLTNGKLTSI